MTNPFQIHPSFIAHNYELDATVMCEKARGRKIAALIVGGVSTAFAIASLVTLATNPVIASISLLFFTLIAISCRDFYIATNNSLSLVQMDVQALQALENSPLAMFNHIAANTLVLSFFKEAAVPDLQYALEERNIFEILITI